jgi:hypothetical protein
VALVLITIMAIALQIVLKELMKISLLVNVSLVTPLVPLVLDLEDITAQNVNQLIHL